MNTVISRIKRNKLYLDIAELISQRATCKRLRVGAIVTKDNRICGSGYNGTPPYLSHCNPTQCDIRGKCLVSIHAEANLIAAAAKQGISLEGTILYLTHEPCLKCSELILQSGIKEVIFRHSYGEEGGKWLLQRQGVLVKHINAE